ncbi:MAG: TRAP transporter large permease subunit [Bacilli bacterium]|nr:TRAP transporter large permease subunit [Bacilli bacterium]
MLLQIELIYFIVMIGVFVALLLGAKLPSGLCLMASALVGMVMSAIFSKTAFEFRYLVEGAFGYFDTILTITTAMIFMGALQITGALEYISAIIVKLLRKWPTLLLIALMIIIMFPAMVTGSSLASAISAGALVAPIMIKWGIPRAKTGAIVAMGSILGMVAPPVNVPAMVICDVVDIPYTNFTLPLLLLVLPIAIVSVILLGRKYVKPIEEEEVSKVVNTDILKEVKWTVAIPLYVLIALIIGEMIWPKILGSFAMPGMFVVSTIVAFFFGRKVPFYKKHENQENENDEDKAICVVDVVRLGVLKSFGAMGLLMGVGMFMEVIALNGVRSFFVANALMLPNFWKYISMAITLPVFGGISAFGSASVLGGPFVMSMYTTRTSITLTCGFSLMAAIGEFLPPTAMSATFAASMVEEKKWSVISKAALPAFIAVYVYGLVYIILFAKLIFDEVFPSTTAGYLILFGICMILALAFAFVYQLILNGMKKKEASELEEAK